MTTTTAKSADLASLVAQHSAHVRSLRHEIHRHPELMYSEHRTSELVVREITELGIEHVAGLARGTGVLGYLPATTDPAGARTVALRADMDALPITEATGASYASENPGIMHACGHDGHTSILLGVARVLSALPERHNNVMLIFQPAEEGGAGGEKMCQDGVLTGKVCGKPVDVIYGLHGWPDVTLGQVAVRNGPMLASTDDFKITVRATGGHAAYPHYTPDPIVIASHIITALQTISSRRTDPLDSIVCTVGAIHAGTVNNVIPSECEFIGTIRTLKQETRTMAEREFRRIVEHTARAHGAEVEIDWHVGYPVTINHDEPTERLRVVARTYLGEDRLLEQQYPSMGGEDFAFYGKHVPACFFLLGLCPADQDEYPNVHTPEFNFNDDAIPTGVEMMCRMALDQG